MTKKLLLYLLRWQLSGVILAPVIFLVTSAIWAAVIGNFIGGLIFFWVDRIIFSNKISLKKKVVQMTINQKLIPPGLGNTPGRNMMPKYITIHNTGNYAAGAAAKNHADLQYRGHDGKQVSWHYTVDKNEIWQSLLDTQQGWHAGDGGNQQGGNYTSIGIEICVNFGFTPTGVKPQNGVKPESQASAAEKALAREGFIASCKLAAELTAYLLQKWNLPIDAIRQHNDWSDKDCPAELRSGAWGVSWIDFLTMVKSFMSTNGSGSGEMTGEEATKKIIEKMGPEWVIALAKKLN